MAATKKSTVKKKATGSRTAQSSDQTVKLLAVWLVLIAVFLLLIALKKY